MNRNYILTRRGQDIFEPFFDELFNMPFASKTTGGLMKTDIEEQEKSYLMTIEVPSFNKEDIKIELENGYLTINATKEDKTEENDEKNYVFKERTYGSYSRSYYVGDDIKEENIHAKMENGLLFLTIDKVEPQEPKKNYISIH